MRGAGAMRPREYARGVRLVAGREVGAAFASGVAQVFTIACALLATSAFMNGFFLAGVVDMGGFFELLPPLLAFFLAAVAMRLWSEERRQRTIELLLTLPLVPSQAVLGKFLAGLALHGLFLAATLPIPLMLGVLGAPDWGAIASGYLGLALFGALFLSFGGLCSALSRDQITAFVASALVGLLLVLLGNAHVVAVLDGLFPSLGLGTFLRDTVSVLPPYEDLVRGVVELSAVLYFVLTSAVFLLVTALVLERQRD